MGSSDRFTGPVGGSRVAAGCPSVPSSGRYALVCDAADRVEVSIAQYVREAALMRAGVDLSLSARRQQKVMDRGGCQFVEAMHEVSKRVVELSAIPGGPVHRG